MEERSMEQQYLLADLYEARWSERVVRVLYKGEWLEGIVTMVESRVDMFDMEMPGVYWKKGLDIWSVEKVEEMQRTISGLAQGNSIKIWLDDLRPVPEGYEGARSVREAIDLIEQIEASDGEIELIDVDHDLGDWAPYGGDAIKLLDYLVERETFYPIQIHTANPVGRANMERMIRRYWP